MDRRRDHRNRNNKDRNSLIHSRWKNKGRNRTGGGAEIDRRKWICRVDGRENRSCAPSEKGGNFAYRQSRLLREYPRRTRALHHRASGPVRKSPPGGVKAPAKWTLPSRLTFYTTLFLAETRA